MDKTIPLPLRYRPMSTADLGRVPIDCQGTQEDVRSRIADLGASAMLVFDGDQHVGQLQFRRYDPDLRSPDGIMSPLYWGDFHEAQAPTLPARTISLFCYHVGQLSNGEERDSNYHGRGIGVGLLEELVRWADDSGVEAIVAKAVPPFRPLAIFMGGHPSSVYEEHGFATVARWRDRDLRARLPALVAGERGDALGRTLRRLRDEGLGLDDLAQVGMVMRRRP
jgi:GNAT superfamily N-acetyltransferase